MTTLTRHYTAQPADAFWLRAWVLLRIWLAGKQAHVLVRGTDGWQMVISSTSLFERGGSIVLEDGTMIGARDIQRVASKNAATGYGP